MGIITTFTLTGLVPVIRFRLDLVRVIISSSSLNKGDCIGLNLASDGIVNTSGFDVVRISHLHAFRNRNYRLRSFLLVHLRGPSLNLSNFFGSCGIFIDRHASLSLLILHDGINLADHCVNFIVLERVNAGTIAMWSTVLPNDRLTFFTMRLKFFIGLRLIIIHVWRILGGFINVVVVMLGVLHLSLHFLDGFLSGLLSSR